MGGLTLGVADQWLQPYNGTETGFTIGCVTPPVGCTTYPAVTLYDCGTTAPANAGLCTGGTAVGSALAWTTGTSGNSTVWSTSLSNSLTANHFYQVKASVGFAGCSTNPLSCWERVNDVF
jgi:hypothetical protein